MNAIWWLLIIVAALAVLWFAFGRGGEKVGAGGAGMGKQGGKSRTSSETGGRPTVGGGTDLWPDQTGSNVARSLGANEPPADQQRAVGPAEQQAPDAGAAGARAEGSAPTDRGIR